MTYRRALLVSVKTLSPNDPNCKALNENLASLYKEMGDEEKANEYAARARSLDTPEKQSVQKETLSQAAPSASGKL